MALEMSKQDNFRHVPGKLIFKPPSLLTLYHFHLIRYGGFPSSPLSTKAKTLLTVGSSECYIHTITRLN